jgi:curved DNA-binding protein CbpA
VDLTDSLTLFKRLGVDVPSLSAREFSLAYYRLAKRYHPDQGNDAGHDLMANINAARTTILKASRHPRGS